MNKAFKVLWNDVRRSYVVSSEAQMSHGKPARSSKTLVAAAVAGVLALGASSAFAALPNGPITNDNLPTIGDTGSETTKLISGKGEVVNIQTNGSLSTLKDRLKEELVKADPDGSGLGKTDILKVIVNALGPVKDGSTDHVVITGVTGGNNIMQEVDKTMVSVGLNGLLGNNVGDRFSGQFSDEYTEIKKTQINIGDELGQSNPLVLGVIGGDLSASIMNPTSAERNFASNINIYSGNTAGVIGGSVALNVSAMNAENKALVTTISETNLNIQNSANVGGIIAGGLALATAGNQATSSVKGATNLIINSKTNFENGAIDGLVVGALGGGLAASTGKAVSRVDVQSTNILMNAGMGFGLIGGGAAVVADIDGGTKIKFVLGEGAGTSKSTSGDVNISLGKESMTAGVMGGGVAVADAFSTIKQGKFSSKRITNEADTSTTVTKVVMNLDGETFTGDKTTFINNVKNFLTSIKDLDLNQSESLLEPIKKLPKLDVKGVHIANLGGGATLARGCFEIDGGFAKATSTVTDSIINLNGGYNVATAAGGLAIAIDKTGISRKDQTLSSSEVTNTYINVNGGENILVSGGGLSYATVGEGVNGTDTLVEAKAHVGTANLVVNNGSVDGLFGGGIAVDDTNLSETNASSNTDTIVIDVNGGEVHHAYLQPLTSLAQNNTVNTSPNYKDYVYETTTLVDENKVAILGAGIASGGGAEAITKNSTITLSGGKVDGNVFGGGVATLGGKTKVEENSTINVNGAVVTGDIYAGGLAGSINNDRFTSYANASSEVGTSTINLLAGEVNGDIYAGTGVSVGENAKVSVNSSNVNIAKNGVFKGKKIDATGVTGNASLTKANEAIDLGKATVTGFNKVVATNHAKNFTFDFGEKKATTFEGVFDVNGFTAKEGSTLTLVGDSVLATTGKTDNVAFKVDNGVLALGDKADAMTAHDQLASVNAIPGLYLAGEVNLTDANATIGKVAEGATGVVIGANGSLMADAAADTTVTGTITGTKDSGIYFTNVAEEGANVVFGEDTLQGFDLENGITVDNIRYEVLSNKADNKNTFTFEVITNQAQLYSLGLDGFDGEALNLIEKQDDAASKHIQSLLDQQNTAVTSGEHRHAQLNAAFNVATAAGVQTAGIEGAMLGLDQAAKRASLTNTFADGWTGFAEVTGTQVEMGGSRDMLESKTKLGGLAAGGEYTTGDWTFGALMNLGTGEVKGQGHNAGVKNDVDFYGVQGYVAKRLGQFNVVGQAGWVMTKNDIKHAMGDSADVDANVYTVGARGEVQMALTDSVAVVPYVGVNYLRVETDGYTTKKGFKVDDVTQDLVNVPVGVAVKGDFGDMAGWQMKPVADIAYVHTFGDTNVEAQTGVGAATMATDMDVWSENVGRVRFGLEAQKDNMSFGFTLGGAAGSDDHREVYGQINAKYVF